MFHRSLSIWQIKTRSLHDSTSFYMVNRSRDMCLSRWWISPFVNPRDLHKTKCPDHQLWMFTYTPIGLLLIIHVGWHPAMFVWGTQILRPCVSTQRSHVNKTTLACRPLVINNIDRLSNPLSWMMTNFLRLTLTSNVSGWFAMLEVFAKLTMCLMHRNWLDLIRQIKNCFRNSIRKTIH